jgi:hypothetical protein
MFKRYPLMEAAGDAGAGAGGAAAGAGAAGAAAGAGAAPAEWLKPFGDGAKAFESFKEPTELVTKWTELNTELTTLKAKPATYDWRAEAAKVDGKPDESIAKALGRYNDLPSVAKALVEAQKKISSGELAKPLAKDAKPEEVKAWREANGIPAEVKGYWEKLPDGIVIGKDDQPIFDAYGKIWHEHNVPPSAAHAMAKMYYENLAQAQAAERAVDEQDKQKAIVSLRNEMGPDYDTNTKILNHWLDGMPETLKGLFKDATLGDGTRLFNNTDALKFLMGEARKINPVAHLLPANGEGDMKSVEGELASIKKMMGVKNSDYWKGPKSAGIQKRYQELLMMADQLKKRA